MKLRKRTEENRKRKASNDKRERERETLNLKHFYSIISKSNSNENALSRREDERMNRRTAQSEIGDCKYNRAVGKEG